VVLQASGSVEDYDAATITRIKREVANAAGVAEGQIAVNVVAASVIITINITVPASDTVASMREKLRASFGDAQMASARLSITVEGITIKGAPELMPQHAPLRPPTLPPPSSPGTETPPSSLLTQLDALPAHEAAQLAGPPQSLFESSGVELVCSQARPPAHACAQHVQAGVW